MEPVARGKISKRLVDQTKSGEKDVFVWDDELKGFGLKVTPRGRKVYLVQARLAGRLRRWTIGPHGRWTPDKARSKALRMLALVEEGQDPERENLDGERITVSSWMTTYFDEGCRDKAESTIAVEHGLNERHIKPLLGKRTLASIDRSDAEKFLNDIATGKTAGTFKTEKKRGRARVTGGKGTANRTLALLSSALAFAVDRGALRENPCSRVRPYALKARERYLSDKELASLGDAMRKEEAAGANSSAIAALRLLVLTGCRKSEILGLKWREIDWQRKCLRLEETKTGGSVISIGEPALDLLRNLPRDEESEYVFPASRGEGHLVGLPKVWRGVRKRAKLEGVRLHDLRHSYASFGAGKGVSLLILGKLLGHRQQSTTQRYSHLADDPLQQAAGDISTGIADFLDGRKKPKEEKAGGEE